MHEHIIADLEALAKLQDELHAAMAQYDTDRTRILAPVQELLDDLESRMIEETAEIKAAIAAKEDKIKAAVLAVGETVKGSAIQAVYTNGRITWDAKSLDGYALGHPELLAFRREGQPNVSIREVRR